MSVTRPRLRVVLFAGLAACSSRPVGVSSESSTSTESSDASEGPSESSTSSSDSTSTDTGGPTSPCDCEPGQLCAATCSEVGLGFPPGQSIPEDFRCVDDPACPPDDFDTPACRELACGSPYVYLVDACDSPDDQPPGIDLLCAAFPLLTCDIEVQDCPDGEKCVARPQDDEGLFPADCVPIQGADPHGAPCTADGEPDYTDSCDVDSMCWSGQLTPDPFAGVCLAFCQPQLDPVCPEGSTCESVADELELCVPAP